MKVIAMTVFCVDIYQGLNITCVGGNSLNFAVQCKLSGNEETSILGCIGHDKFGEKVQNYLKSKGFNTAHIYYGDDSTPTNRIYIDSNGDRYFKADSWTDGTFGTFRIPMKDWDFILSHEVIAMSVTDPNLFSVMDNISPYNHLVVDFLDKRDFELIENVMQKISLGFISGNEETVKKLEPVSLKLGIPIVITMGDQGSVCLFRGKRYNQKAVKVERVIDTTGCGDAFLAAFILSFYQNMDVAKALESGAVASSKVLSHFGGCD